MMFESNARLFGLASSFTYINQISLLKKKFKKKIIFQNNLLQNLKIQYHRYMVLTIYHQLQKDGALNLMKTVRLFADMMKSLNVIIMILLVGL